MSSQTTASTIDTARSTKLAVDGAAPVRAELLPYSRPEIDENDIAAVVDALRSGWLTTGPRIAALEAALAAQAGTRDAVALASGTAALHAAMAALGIGAGDEVIVPSLTFAATANVVALQGARPVFADVDPRTLLVTADTIRAKRSVRTKAVVAVDFAGQPCDYEPLRELAAAWNVPLVADACHALGGTYAGQPVGSLADLSTFSLHAVKHVAAGEGGAVTTDNVDWTRMIRRFRNHGIDADHHARASRGTWDYQVIEPGYNYRLSDIQAALAISQLARLPNSLARRRAIARRYAEALADWHAVRPLAVDPGRQHAWHLYIVRLDLDRLTVDRGQVFRALRAEGIGVNVHYPPVHLHPFYRQQFGTAAGDCPAAERAYQEILSLPLFPAMTDADCDDVIEAVGKVTRAYALRRGQTIGGARGSPTVEASKARGAACTDA